VTRCTVICSAVMLVGGCAGDLDPPWQLDHDRIVAVRADPPRIEAKATTHISVLLAHAGAPTSTVTPASIVVVSPPILADEELADGALTAPDERQLGTAREQLALAEDAPVPLSLEIRTAGFEAMTTIWLGATGTNPALDGLQIDGRAPAATLEVAAGVDVSLAVTADDESSSVTWLTSCGTLHDFDLSRALLRVEPEDPHEGELAVVVRDLRGGVTWQVWPIRAR